VRRRLRARVAREGAILVIAMAVEKAERRVELLAQFTDLKEEAKGVAV